MGTLGWLMTAAVTLSLVACSDGDPGAAGTETLEGAGGSAGNQAGSAGSAGAAASGSAGASGAGGEGAAGNEEGGCEVPAEAQREEVSKPTTVIGDGTPSSCTSEAVVKAVAIGGVITFDCGPEPLTIVLEETAKVFNDKTDAQGRVVIDGGDKITLSGGGKRRILYQNTCDQKQTWTSPHCDDQETPKLTVQNIAFVDGDAKGLKGDGGEAQGGGAIYAQGGQLKIVNARFLRNVCDDTGPDVGGGAVRAFMQFEGRPIAVTSSTFGGSEQDGNVCSNGGALSSIGVSWTIRNSVFSYNRAIGHGANPAQSGTPGGGSGGAIYNDGNTMTLSLCGARITDNTANEGGGAIFFVSNDGSGHMSIDSSELARNPSGEFENYPGIFYKANAAPVFTASSIE